MVQVSIEVCSGAARFSVAVRAENIRRAVSLAQRLYPGGDVQVKFPIDSEDFFVAEAVAPAAIVMEAQAPQRVAA